METRASSAATVAVRIVLSTAPDLDTARRLARGLVEARLAACVNLSAGIESIYRWRGAVESASEVLLLIKTTTAELPGIERYLASEHPYELPECVALAPEHVEGRYRDWILSESSGSTTA